MKLNKIYGKKELLNSGIFIGYEIFVDEYQLIREFLIQELDKDLNVIKTIACGNDAGELLHISLNWLTSILSPKYFYTFEYNKGNYSHYYRVCYRDSSTGKIGSYVDYNLYIYAGGDNSSEIDIPLSKCIKITYYLEFLDHLVAYFSKNKPR